MLSTGSQGVISQNTLYQNEALGAGAGIYLELASHPLILNNLFAENHSKGGGAAVHCRADALPYLMDFNAYHENHIGVLGTISHVGRCSMGRHSIIADPQLLDPQNNDFSLPTTSPVRHAGTPDYRYANPDGTRSHIGWTGGTGLPVSSPLLFRGEFRNRQNKLLEQCWSLDRGACAVSPTASRIVSVIAVMIASLGISEHEDTKGARDEILYKPSFSFGPYLQGEDPALGAGQITREELSERLGWIAPYTERVRTFGCDSDLRDIAELAHSFGLETAIGAWLGPDPTVNRAQIDCLIEVATTQEVELAVVGSEVLFRRDLDEQLLLDYIGEVRQAFQSAGVSTLITTAEVDTVSARQSSHHRGSRPSFSQHLSLLWWAQCQCSSCCSAQSYQRAVALAGGKPVRISETGWPSCGNQIGNARPSPANAASYFLNVASWARANGVEVYYFSALDEIYKATAEEPQEGCWGVWDQDGQLKDGMMAVFRGESVPDNWTSPSSDTFLIDFHRLPSAITTNLPTFLIAGRTDVEHLVEVNGETIAQRQSTAPAISLSSSISMKGRTPSSSRFGPSEGISSSKVRRSSTGTLSTQRSTVDCCMSMW